MYLSFGKFKINILSFFAFLIVFLGESLDSFIMIVLALSIHEFGHLIAIRCLGEKVKKIEIEPFGCSITRNRFASYKSDIVVALGGPILGLICAIVSFFVFIKFPSLYLLYFIVINVVYSVFNLIPCSALDGGVFLSALLHLIFDDEKAYRIEKIADAFFSILLIIVIISSGFFSNFNFSLSVISLFLLIVFPYKNKKLKI